MSEPLLILLAILLPASVPTASCKPLNSGDSESDVYYSIEIIPYPPGDLAYEDEHLFYECQQNVSKTVLPTWIINETSYPSSGLPLHFHSIYDGIFFDARKDINGTTFRCCFIIYNTALEEICSKQRVLKIASRIEIHSGPGNVTVASGDEVKLECNYSGTAALPLWLISDNTYAASDLPVIYHYEADSIHFEATKQMNGTTFQCIIWAYGPDGLYLASSGIGMLTVKNDAKHENTELSYPERPEILGSCTNLEADILSIYWEEQQGIDTYQINYTTCETIIHDNLPLQENYTSSTQFNYVLNELKDMPLFKIGIPYYSKEITTFYFSPAGETISIPCSKNQYVVAIICGGENVSSNVECRSTVPEVVSDFKHHSRLMACPDQVCMKRGSNFTNSQCVTFETDPLPPFSNCTLSDGYGWCASAKDFVNETLISYQSSKTCCPTSSASMKQINCESERGSFLIFVVGPPMKPVKPCLLLNYDRNTDTVIICLEEPYTHPSYPIMSYNAIFKGSEGQKVNISFSESYMCQPLGIPGLKNLSYPISMRLEAESEAGTSESSDEADTADGNVTQFCNCLGRDMFIPTLTKGNASENEVVVEITQQLLPAAFPPELKLEFCNLSLIMNDVENRSFSPNFTVFQPINCSQNEEPFNVNLTITGLEVGTEYTLLAQVPFVINGTKIACSLHSVLITVKTENQKSTYALFIGLGTGLGTLVLITVVIVLLWYAIRKRNRNYNNPSSTTYLFDQAPPYQHPKPLVEPVNK